MKTIDRSVVAETSPDVQSRSLRIEANGKAFKELISGIYADKAYAILRETVANGIDSHVQAGIPQRPIVIHMPTILEPFYSIRDFGVSMAHDMVMELYSTLFRSTKDDPNSDDSNKYVGKFGLGSKSPFAYTDHFQLTCYLDGKARIYDIFFNGGIPQIALLDESDTTEETGVLVQFGVAAKDFSDFERAAKRTIEGLEVLPIFTGKQIVPHARKVLMQGEGWKLLDGTQSGRAEARQGTVLYPLNQQAVINLPSEYSAFFDAYFRFDFEIGQLDVVTSREALSYDEETSNNIITRLGEVLEDIRAQLAVKIDGAETYWSFSSAYFAAVHSLPSSIQELVMGDTKPVFGARRREPTQMIGVKTNNVLTKNKVKDEKLGIDKEVITFQARFGTLTYCKITEYDLRNKVLSFRIDKNAAKDQITLDCTKRLIVVHEDMNAKNRYPAARIKQYVESLADEDKRGVQLLWVRHYGDKDYVMKRIFVAFGRPTMTIVNLMDIPYDAPPRQYFSGPRTNFRLFNKRTGEFETPDAGTAIPDRAWYVTMRNGQIDSMGLGFKSLSQVREAIDVLLAHGDEDLPIVGVPVAGRKLIKNNPDWRDFFEYVSDTVPGLIVYSEFAEWHLQSSRTDRADAAVKLDVLRKLVKKKVWIDATTGSQIEELMDLYDAVPEKDKVPVLQNRTVNLLGVVEGICNDYQRHQVEAHNLALYHRREAGEIDVPADDVYVASTKAKELTDKAETAVTEFFGKMEEVGKAVVKAFPLIDFVDSYQFNRSYYDDATKKKLAVEFVNYIFNKRLVGDDEAEKAVDLAVAA